MKKLVIIDADSIIWTVAYKFRNKRMKNFLITSLNKFIEDVLVNTGATHYLGFYGSKEPDRTPNFRYALQPDYKGNRPDEPEWFTKWCPVLQQEMKDHWGFHPIDGMEADDAVGICATHYNDDYDVVIVASPDKDLKTVPNVTFYNYSKHEQEDITELIAMKNFGKQVLKGDSGDNVKGLFNVGPRKANSLIDPCDTVVDVKWTVYRMYAGYEETLRKKGLRTLTKDIRATIEESDWAQGKTVKQIDRKVRLKSGEKVEEFVEEKMPGGWKDYLRLQSKLLTILTEAPDWYDVPEPTEYEVEVVDQDATDKFLYNAP